MLLTREAIDLGALHPESTSPIQAKSLGHRRAIALSLTVVIGAINEAIKHYKKWYEKDWVFRAHYRWTRGSSWYLLSRILRKPIEEISYEVRQYDAEVRDYDPMTWFSEYGLRWCENCGIDPLDCIDIVKDVVEGRRQFGITEVDVEELYLPGFEDQREVRSDVRITDAET